MKRFLNPLIGLTFGLAIGLTLVLPVSAQANPTVKVATDPTLGKILVDGAGKTLYLYSRDTKGQSNCYDACETRWPILRPPASGAPTGSSDINGTLGSIKRNDNTMQVTYNDIPLYYFQNDEKAGDTKGQAVGGIWWVVAPGTNQITPAAAAQPSPSPAPAGAPAAKPSGAPAAAPAAQPAAKPAGSPAPAQAPGALPRTGGMPLESLLLVVGSGLAGLTATAFGTRMLRRRRPR